MVVSSVGSSGDALVESARQKNVLDMQDFLNLLIMQLKNQDPIEPVDNSEFLGQMAQFSNLEMMNNMSNSLSDLTAVEKMVEARQLIGSQVDYVDEVTEATLSGVVTAVVTVGNSPMLVIDGSQVDPSTVVRVSTAA